MKSEQYGGVLGSVGVREYKGWASSLGSRSNTGLEGQSNTGARWESVGSEQYGLSTIFGLIGKFRKSEQCMGLVGILIIQGSVGQTRATAFRVGGFLWKY